MKIFKKIAKIPKPIEFNLLLYDAFCWIKNRNRIILENTKIIKYEKC